MTKTNSGRAWNKYMSDIEGGFYIKDNRVKGTVHYGPFKTQKFAEFFNFIAFGSPRECNAKEEAQSGIVFCEEVPSNKRHPKLMFASNSRFSLSCSLLSNSFK